MAAQADTCACGCGTSLGRSPSDHFATEACQRRWQRKQAGAPHDGADAELLADAAQLQAAHLEAILLPADALRWVYLAQQATWELRENNQPLWRVTEEAALHTRPGAIEGHIEQRLGRWIPPIPRHPMH